MAFILRYLAGEISKKSHYQCGVKLTSADCTPRVDAQASDGRAGIGGWFPACDQEGRLSQWLSSWFSLEITCQDFPWIFEKGNRPSLVISTLEAFAMLVALKLKFGQDPEPNDTRVLIAPSKTDNRGNGAALNKLMSTRFPSSAVLVELASFMKAREMRAVVEWAPRECNREADLLANGITDLFDPERRLPVSAQTLGWNVLPEALSRRRSGTGVQANEGVSRSTQQGPEAEEEESRNRTQGY